MAWTIRALDPWKAWSLLQRQWGVIQRRAQGRKKGFPWESDNPSFQERNVACNTTHTHKRLAPTGSSQVLHRHCWGWWGHKITLQWLTGNATIDSCLLSFSRSCLFASRQFRAMEGHKCYRPKLFNRSVKHIQHILQLRGFLTSLTNDSYVAATFRRKWCTPTTPKAFTSLVSEIWSCWSCHLLEDTDICDITSCILYRGLEPLTYFTKVTQQQPGKINPEAKNNKNPSFRS